MGHVHAELMMEYAKDAMETDKPWERWEAGKSNIGIYIDIDGHPTWDEDLDYRRKPCTININGREVPEPVREPLKEGQKYYIPSLEYSPTYNCVAWADGTFDRFWLERGLIHLTREAATAHAKELLSFTQKD